MTSTTDAGTALDEQALAEQALAGLAAARTPQDKAAAQALLRQGLELYPGRLDSQGDPLFHKELLRSLLADGRFFEIRALAPPDAGIGRPGWHHILFARALSQHGFAEQAREHWQAILDAQPGNPEALAALDAPLLPRMSEAERDMFAACLKDVRHYLEFGAGGSTAFVARAGVPAIVSVESDADWLDRLADLPEIRAIDFTPFPVDIGPTGDWGIPADPAMAPSWPGYYRKIWKQLAWTPDLVLVDGRFRVACTLSAVLHCPPGTPLLIHDFWNRPGYHVVLKHLETVDRVHTLGLFRTRQEPDLRALAADLLDHALDHA